MKNNFEVGQRVTFSVGILFNHILGDNYDNDIGYVDTTNGEIYKEIGDNCEYYDYYEGNQIVSMDGETCIITCVGDDFVEFKNDDGEFVAYGRLTIEEANVSLFRNPD